LSDLRDVLTGYLEYVGADKNWLAKASLTELVKKALDYKTK